MPQCLGVLPAGIRPSYFLSVILMIGGERGNEEL